MRYRQCFRADVRYALQYTFMARRTDRVARLGGDQAKRHTTRLLRKREPVRRILAHFGAFGAESVELIGDERFTEKGV